MLYQRCLFLAFVVMVMGSIFLWRSVSAYMPKPLYLLRTYGLYMLAYWMVAWINLGSLLYLGIRHFKMIETGRKLRHLDPTRSEDGLFGEEVRRDA